MPMDICYSRASLVFQKYCNDSFRKSLENHDKKYETIKERSRNLLILYNHIPHYINNRRRMLKKAIEITLNKRFY